MYNLPREQVQHKEKDREKIVRFVYALVDTENKRVLWHYPESFMHLPSAYLPDPRDPNSGYIAKPVERYYLSEEAPASARPHRNHRTLSSELTFEVIYIKKTETGISMTEVYDSDVVITGLEALEDQLKISTKTGVVFRPLK